MSNRCYTGGVTVWAWLLSVALHLFLIAVFAFVEFSQVGGGSDQAAVPVATVELVKQIAHRSVVTPKPKVRSLLSLEYIQPAPSFENPSELTSRRPDIGDRSFVPADSKSVMFLPVEDFTCPGVEFFGQKSSLRKVCYVIDCSGSMHGMLGQVQEQLRTSIRSLEPDQYFYIIFFCNDNLLESGKGYLARATVAAKSDAYDFINTPQVGGKGDCRIALERAMRIRDPAGRPPELIYFLTDGFEFGADCGAGFSESVLDLRNGLAPSVQINVIGFWTKSADGVVLERIAQDSGGKFINIE